jgi:glutamate N-acetyltransferase / amino-acid N-acetyltransferase
MDSPISASRFAPLPKRVTQVPGSVTLPDGYRAAGVHCGIKRRRRDIGVLVSDVPTASAVFFTTNAAAAAPVLVTRGTCDCAALQAVVVNSGIANASTGSAGYADALRMRTLTAAQLKLPMGKVAVSSTGVIGGLLPMDMVETGIHRCVAKLSENGGEHFAEAIRTTDRSHKMMGLTVKTRRGEVHMGFASKGAGMISPNMATTLSFVTTDAAVPGGVWHEMMQAAVRESFNRITVDGQESTNDMVLGLANGAVPRALDDADLERLSEALRFGLLSMALAVVADGEGSTTTVRLTVTGGHDAAEAESVARAIANSPLVKTSVFGHDANWGRVVSAAGMVVPAEGGRSFLPDVAYGEVFVLRGGDPVALTQAELERLEEILADRELDLSVDLHRGTVESVVYFSDLTHDYVRLNAGRRT